MFTWASLTNVTNASVRRQISSNPRAFLNLEPDLALQVPALDLPYRCDELVHDLVAAGTTSATNEFLAGTFGRAVEATGQRFQETFIRTMQGIAPTFEDSDALQEMGRVLKVRYEEDFKAAIARIRYSLLAEVAAHRSRMLATTTHERGAFSDETTAILQAVYERQPNVSRREKQALSERTGLSLTQVATWFANRRARPDKYPRANRPSALPYPARTNARAPRRSSSLRTFSHFSNISAESDDSLAPSSASFDRDDAPSPPSFALPQYDLYATEQRNFPPLDRVVYSDWDESESPYSSSSEEESRRASSSPSPPSHFDLYLPSSPEPHFLPLHPASTPTPSLSAHSGTTSAFRNPFHDPSIGLHSAQTNSSPPISPDPTSETPFPPTNFFQGIGLDLGAYDSSFWRGIFDSNDAISNGALEMDLPGSMGGVEAPELRVVDADLEGEEDTEMGEGEEM